MSNHFNGYGLFKDVVNPTLRTWNRINVYLNIKENHGRVVGINYLKRFHRNDQLAIATMMKSIYEIGYAQVRRNISRTGAVA